MSENRRNNNDGVVEGENRGENRNNAASNANRAVEVNRDNEANAAPVHHTELGGDVHMVEDEQTAKFREMEAKYNE
ncbi:MAG: hypothetical protein ACXWFC_11970, partial [Nitrososphaeraceae archaeon]